MSMRGASSPTAEQLGRLVELFAKAERPLIVAGNGVVISEAWDELTRFAEALSIPVATSLGGKGAIDEMNDLAVGVIGRNSRKVGNDTVRGCDAVLAIGTRLGGLATHRWPLPFGEKRLFQIDPDPQILGHNSRPKSVSPPMPSSPCRRRWRSSRSGGLARGATGWTREVIANIGSWRGYAATDARDQKVDGIHPAEVMSALREVMAPNDIIGADTGAHGGWVGGLFPVAAGKTMVRANGSLGWVFPGAMGAALAEPSRRMVAVAGDGGMLYHIAEFETALRCNIPVVVVVLNNACLASEYHSQKKHGRVVNDVVDFRDVDFAAVARAFGAHGVRVERSADLEDAIRGCARGQLPGACRCEGQPRSPVAVGQSRCDTQGLRRRSRMYDCQFEWPDGAHIAVVFDISRETWEKKLGTSDKNSRSRPRPRRRRGFAGSGELPPWLAAEQVTQTNMSSKRRRGCACCR